MGYPKGTRGIFYSLEERKVFISAHANYLEYGYMDNFKPTSMVVLEELSNDVIDV